MKKAKDILYLISISTLIVLLIINQEKAKAGYEEGIRLCTGIIVPALLPIMILTSSIIQSRSADIIESSFKLITRKVFNLPAQASTAIILGMIAGFPSGAILTNQLLNQGIISCAQARKIMRYNFCGGASFIITAIGSIKLKSTKLGIVIYIINILSCLIVGITQGIIIKDTDEKIKEITRLSPADALVAAIEDSTKSIILMCTYIVFFSAISSMIKIPSYIAPIIEITNGLFLGNINIPFPLICFFLSFGGLCIHFQLIGIISKFGMKYYDFLTSRLLAGIISYFLGKGYQRLFPNSVEVFSNMSSLTPQISQVNYELSIVLLIGCVIIVLDLNNKKSKLIKYP